MNTIQNFTADQIKNDPKVRRIFANPHKRNFRDIHLCLNYDSNGRYNCKKKAIKMNLGFCVEFLIGFYLNQSLLTHN